MGVPCLSRGRREIVRETDPSSIPRWSFQFSSSWCRPECSLCFRHRSECGIELHERVVDGAAFGMARLATCVVGECFCCWSRCAESKEGPLVGKTLLVLDFHFNAGDLILKVAAIIDRSFTGRRAEFENEHCFVGPYAGSHEGLVRRRRHEDVVKLRIGC